VLWWIWSTHLLFGRPGQRFQSRPGRRPSDRSTCARRAWWARTSSLSLAIWLKIAMRRLAICSPTDMKPVCDETVALLMWSIQRIPEICCWHLMWKASRVLRSMHMLRESSGVPSTQCYNARYQFIRSSYQSSLWVCVSVCGYLKGSAGCLRSSGSSGSLL